MKESGIENDCEWQCAADDIVWLCNNNSHPCLWLCASVVRVSLRMKFERGEVENLNISIQWIVFPHFYLSFRAEKLFSYLLREHFFFSFHWNFPFRSVCSAVNTEQPKRVFFSSFLLCVSLVCIYYFSRCKSSTGYQVKIARVNCLSLFLWMSPSAPSLGSSLLGIQHIAFTATHWNSLPRNERTLDR